MDAHTRYCPPGCLVCNFAPYLRGPQNNAYTIGDITHAFLTIILIPVYLLLCLPGPQFFLRNITRENIEDFAEKIFLTCCMLEEFGTGPFVWFNASDDISMMVVLVSIYFLYRRERRDEDARILAELRAYEIRYGFA